MNEFPETRVSLLGRLKDPVDGTAWGTFVAAYGSLVYGETRRRGLTHQDAEDVTQEVFSRCLKSIRNFEYEPTRGRFRDWLGMMVRNEVFRFRRDRGRETADSVVVQDIELLSGISHFHEPQWSEAFQTRILEVAIDLCRDRFEPETWLAFSRVWLENQSAVSVAIEMSKPVDWVYVAKSRVLKSLRSAVMLIADDWPFEKIPQEVCVPSALVNDSRERAAPAEPRIANQHE